MYQETYSLQEILKRKNNIITCKKYPNCNSFQSELKTGDTICGKAELCQIEMKYIKIIESLQEL